jgi:hypothetical protein
MTSPAPIVLGRKLREEAVRLGLLSSPPYSTEVARSAWKRGYETALEDVAAGKLRAAFAEARAALMPLGNA